MADEAKYFAPSIFVNHGGGPFPVYGEKHNQEIAKSLREVRNYVDFTKLKAIILVTAHWEDDIVSISSGENNDLLYDYSNFPPETYEYKYGARGDPILARRIHEALSKEGVASRLDDKRGWDHGVFIPLMLIRPEADIPIVQVSVLKNQDAKQHFQLGKILYQFRKDGVAIIGSGLSYHNYVLIKAAKNTDAEDPDIKNEEFDAFLNEVCTGDEEARLRLLSWEDTPGGLEAHPRGKAEHFMPLIVATAAAGASPGKKVHGSAFYNQFKISGFVWN